MSRWRARVHSQPLLCFCLGGEGGRQRAGPLVGGDQLVAGQALTLAAHFWPHFRCISLHAPKEGAIHGRPCPYSANT